ncbi:hypothetical protein KFK09_006931 [Dendrobium nobile]|uniref:Uncharacterized protein n=1 Tax=Dendrobium nobile TaxID=94219 RepID=A0A8T3BVE5_DENNO|nr:hypothetical protein KFK09_006931 [Dendrobium nobile]
MKVSWEKKPEDFIRLAFNDMRIHSINARDYGRGDRPAFGARPGIFTAIEKTQGIKWWSGRTWSIRWWSDRTQLLGGGPVELQASSGGPAELRASSGGPEELRASSGRLVELHAVVDEERGGKSNLRSLSCFEPPIKKEEGPIFRFSMAEPRSKIHISILSWKIKGPQKTQHFPTIKKTKHSMAEAIVLSVMENTASTIVVTAWTKISSLKSRLSEVHSRLEHINSIFLVMSGSLKDIDEMKDYKHEVAAWRKQVIDVAYEVEDIVDEYSYLTRERHRKDFKGLFYNIIHILRDSRTWYRAANHLQNIETMLNNIINMKDQFGIFTSQRIIIGNNSNDDNGQISHFAESSHFKMENEIIGIKKNRNLIENWLAGNETSQYVIAVWGMAGVGKTTLATNVYNRQKKDDRFSSFAWILVTQTYNINDLLRNIILELYEEDSLQVLGQLPNLFFLGLYDDAYVGHCRNAGFQNFPDCNYLN